METKDNTIINKVKGSVENTRRSVDVLPSFRALIKKKISSHGNATVIEETTGVLRQTLSRVAEGKKVRRKSLETLVHWFISPDANVDDYIKKVI